MTPRPMRSYTGRTTPARIREPRPAGPSRFWLRYLLAGVTAAVVYVLLPQTRLTAWMFPLINTSGAFAAAAGILRGRTRNRAAWWTITAALALSAAGDVVYAGYDLLGRAAPFPSAADPLYLLAHLAAPAGGVLLSRRAGRDSLLDAGILTIPLAVLAWYVVIEPTIDVGGTPTAMFLAVASPVGTLAVLLAMMRAALSLEMRKLPAQLLVLGMACWFVPDAYYATASLTGTYTAGGPMDLGWMLFPVLIGAAALHPRMHEINVSAHRPAGVMTLRRFLVVQAGVLSLIAADALNDQAHMFGDDDTTVFSAAILISGLATALRLQGPIRTLGARATTDALTGLPNRPELLRRLSAALADLPVDGGERVGLLFCDLDHFKDVNDTLGHEAGDRLLIAIAQRIRTCVRVGDTVARLGGDEFVILLPHCDGVAPLVADRLATTFTAAVPLGQGVDFFPSVSVGVRITDDPYADPSSLLAEADAAMYHAKNGGRGRAVHFDGRFTAEAANRIRMDAELRRAVAEGELVCHYQPEIDLRTGRLYALEALVRWNHPTQGLLAPGVFIPYAEANGVIGMIFRRVLDEALNSQDRWQATYGWRPPVAVNVSAQQASDPDLVDAVLAALAAHGAGPSALILEVTETALVENEPLGSLLGRLREHGVAIAIDDFGTGYSTVARVVRWDWDTLKIDMRFTSEIATSAKHRGIVDAMVTMAHALGLTAVAEGVEDQATVDVLRELGCDAAQGYLLARPMPFDQMTAMIGANPAWRSA